MRAISVQLPADNSKFRDPEILPSMPPISKGSLIPLGLQEPLPGQDLIDELYCISTLPYDISNVAVIPFTSIVYIHFYLCCTKLGI